MTTYTLLHPLGATYEVAVGTQRLGLGTAKEYLAQLWSVVTVTCVLLGIV